MARFRKIVFYLFAAIYLMLCPALILYALGYLLEPGAEHGVVKTGLLSLSTLPQDASVYVGRTRYTEKTPTIIRNLLPGNYPLTLTLAGYKSWAKTAVIEAGKSTAFEKILLVPEEWQSQELTLDSFEELLPVPGNPFFLLKRGPRAQDYFVFDAETAESWSLFPGDFPLLDAKVLSIHTVNESPFLLVSLDSRGDRTFLWVEPRKKEPLVEDLTVLFEERPQDIQWDPHERHVLFTFQEGHLNRLEIDSKICTPRILKGIRGFGLFHKTIYALRDDGVLLQMDEEGKNQETLLSDASVTGSLFGENRPYAIHVLSKEIVLFLGRRGELLANRLPYRFVGAGVRGFEFDPKRQRLLLWKKGGVGILDFSREEPEAGLFEQGPRMAWVYAKGGDIQQAFWVYDGSHVLFRDGQRVLLLDLDALNGEPDELFQAKETSPVVYSETTGKLYYLEQGKGRLSSAQIVARKNLLLK